MARIGPAALRGYILEEVLSYLIRQSGYSLLTSPKQDEDALARRGNGLVVKGRGAEHQVDVLGELDWTPSFTFPIRLFLEAKSQGGKVGIQTVRNAVGVLSDINQRNVQATREPLTRRFRYAYALVSTSGFSGPASNMAFAHEVSLLDMSGAEYAPLNQAISEASKQLIASESGSEDSVSSEIEIDMDDQPSLVSRTRATLRVELGTDPQVSDEPLESDPGVARVLRRVIGQTHEIGNLFVGMGAGPYMLLLRAKNRGLFLNRMLQSPVLLVRVGWSRSQADGREWTVRPVSEPLDFSLSFRLPEPIADWIFSEKSGSSSRARAFKKAMPPHMFIPFRDDRQVDHLFRLEYQEPGAD